MSRTIRRSLRAAVIAATGLSLVAQGTAAADPLTDPLFKFHGTVSDPIGRGVAVATVADGTKSVQTSATGGYELGERDFNKTYRLVASKPGMETVSKDVAVGAPLDTRVDFTLQYRTTASIVRRYLSTSEAPASTTINVQTYAPNPGLPGQSGGLSCVKVTDSGTGSQTSASYASTSPDGAVNWVWTLNLAAAAPERSGTLTVRTVDCATGTALSRDTAVTYVVDNTAPVIRNVFPVDGTLSTFAASQQLGASFKDSGGAGIDTPTIGVKVTDTVTGATKVFAGSQVAYNASTGQATAGPTSLTTNHRHTVAITVKDRAGNTTTFGHRTSEDGGFTPVDTTVNPVTFRVPRVDCTLGETNLTTRKRAVVCRDVKLSLDSTSVKFSQVPHAGFGFLNMNAPLNGVKLVLVQPTGETVTYPYGGTKFHPLKFGTTTPSATELVMTTPAGLLNLDDVNREIEAPLATAAYLLLGDTNVTPSLQGCAGQGAIAGAVTCLSDSLHSVVNVTVKSGYAAADVAAAHAAAYGFEVLGAGGGQYGAIIPDAYVDDVRGDARVAEVARELPFTYHVPVSELVKAEITNTPEGQAAAANSGIIAGVGTCTGGLRVFNMGMAAGTPNTGGALQTIVWPEEMPLTDVSAFATGGNGFALEYGDLASPTATTVAASNACNGGQWQRKSGSCSSGRVNDTSYLTCPKLYWLSNDNYADADFWSVSQKTTGRGVSWGRYLRKMGGETVADQGKQVMGWEDFDPYQDVWGDCRTEITVGIEVKGVGLSGSKWYLCERWDATIWHSEDGHNANVWRGDIPDGQDRGAEHMGAVSIPATAGVETISWKVLVHACASWAYWSCG